MKPRVKSSITSGRDWHWTDGTDIDYGFNGTGSATTGVYPWDGMAKNRTLWTRIVFISKQDGRGMIRGVGIRPIPFAVRLTLLTLRVNRVIFQLPIPQCIQHSMSMPPNIVISALLRLARIIWNYPDILTEGVLDTRRSIILSSFWADIWSRMKHYLLISRI